MTELQRGLSVWVPFGLLFLAFELPSRDVLGWAPWPSLSATVRDGISWWHVFALFVTVLLLVLLGHFVLGWRARYLIGAASVSAVAVVVHLLFR